MFKDNDHSELLQPKRVWQGSEILSGNCHIPKLPGIYAWYFRSIPPEIPTAGCTICNELTLLYIGVAPSKASSKRTLHDRIELHLTGDADVSTLRLSLGCLLSDTLGIQLRRVSRTRMTFVDGEQRLSAWLADNAFVVWAIRSEPWKVEVELIQSLSLPLNLQHNRRHPFYPVLSAKRHLARNQASSLPVYRINQGLGGGLAPTLAA